MAVLIGNILNIIAPIIQILASTLKSKIKVLFGIVIAAVTWVIAYILLGIKSAAILSAVEAAIPIVNFVFEKKRWKKHWSMYVVLFAIIITVAVVFYENPIELLPSIAVVFFVFSIMFDKQVYFRLCLILMASTFLIYGILKMQFGIIVGNVIDIVFLIATMIFYSLKKEKPTITADGNAATSAIETATESNTETATERSEIFITDEKRKEIGGTCFHEIQFCTKDLPAKKLVQLNNIHNWATDSLYLDAMFDEDDLFYKNYNNIFGQFGKLDYFGINYFTKEQAQKILSDVQSQDLPDKDTLIAWLEVCINNYNGFYFLGV